MVEGNGMTQGPPPLGITARASVDRIIDGDTLVVHVEWPVTIRLADCWAPEIRKDDYEGHAAKNALTDILPPGSDCVLNVRSDRADNLGDLLTFGRVLADVWSAGDQVSASERMVVGGYATKEKPSGDS
jgi:endonuclease YncB( thermonuclease family)